jgi:hypothetical protein
MRIFTLPDGIKSTALNPTEIRRYKIADVASKNTANGIALAATPAIVSTIYGLLYRQDIQISQSAYNQWIVEVPYGPRKAVTGDFTWDFDTTGGTIHITQAKQEVGRFPAASAPDQRGAIGVDGDEVKGTDIIVPAMKINVNFRHPYGVITLPQAKFLANITGTTNATPFLTFPPGEVLFLGARGQDGSEAEATVSYQFAMAANQVGMTIGEIANVSKRAWEVAWIRYQDNIVTSDGKEVPTREPKFVYVDRVYDEIDMATALGFGG